MLYSVSTKNILDIFIYKFVINFLIKINLPLNLLAQAPLRGAE